MIFTFAHLKRLKHLTLQHGHQLKAFSLLEISIVLTILGVISSYAIPLLLKTHTQQKYKETEIKFEFIARSLSAFAQQHKRLPAPANPEQLQTVGGTEQVGLASGIIPFQTLGIAEKEAKDGFNRWVSYTPDPTLTRHLTQVIRSTSTNNQAPLCQHKVPLAPLRVDNQFGLNVINNITSDFVAFVLVSHGASGNGAFDYQGRRTPCSGEKCGNVTGQPFTDKVRTKDNDDQVKWYSRNNFISYYLQQTCSA